MKVIQKTHTGNVRENNEDFILVQCGNKPYYMLVADGMGGAAAGEIASKIAAFSVRQYFEGLKKELLEPADLIDAVKYANEQIVKETFYNDRLKGMGTTMTLACIAGNTIIIAQVGDSCAYLFSENNMMKVTKDHTYVQKLIDCGYLDKSKAEDNPFKHIITRVVGMNDLIVDTYEINWKENDMLLLCTDGLTSCANEAELMEIIFGSGEFEKKAEELIEIALEKGGRDNVSVIVAKNDTPLEAN